MLATTNGVYRWDTPDAYLARVAAAGAAVVRDDCYSGTCDRYLSLAKAHGLKLVLILSGAGQNPAPSTIASFASSLVKYADANYPGTLLALEPMNEPNIGTFSSNPAGYVTMHNAVYNAVHQTGTAIQVWCCATSGTGIGGWTPAVLDAGVKFDEWSAHPYSAWGYKLATASAMLDLNRASGWSEMPKLATLLQSKRGFAGPINGTEFGAPSNPPGGTCNRCETEQVEADLITQGFAQWKQWSWAGTLFVYTAQDDKTNDTTNLENHFGLYRSDNSAKPAVAALQAVGG
jgi:polysaccharide biosynthesis protein PslG